MKRLISRGHYICGRGPNFFPVKGLDVNGLRGDEARSLRNIVYSTPLTSAGAPTNMSPAMTSRPMALLYVAATPPLDRSPHYDRCLLTLCFPPPSISCVFLSFLFKLAATGSVGLRDLFLQFPTRRLNAIPVDSAGFVIDSLGLSVMEVATTPRRLSNLVPRRPAFGVPRSSPSHVCILKKQHPVRFPPFRNWCSPPIWVRALVASAIALARTVRHTSPVAPTRSGNPPGVFHMDAK